MPIFSQKNAPGSAPAPLGDKGKGPALIQRHPRSTATAGPSRSTASRNVPPSPVASPEGEPCLAVATRATGLVPPSRRGRAQPLFHDTMNGLVEAGTRLQRAAGTRGVNMFNFQTSINVNEDTVRAGLNDVATITQTLGNLAYPKEAAGLGDDRDPVDGTWRDFIPGRASFASGSRWSFRFFFRLLRMALFALIIPLTMLLTFAIYNRAVMPNLQGQAREATAGMNDFNRQMNEFFCTFAGSGWILQCEDKSSTNGTTISGTQLAHPLVDEVKEAFVVQTGTFGQLYNTSGGSSPSMFSLSLNMDKARVATLALASEVDSSGLGDKEELARILRAFASDADTAGRALSSFHSSINSALDDILGADRFALKLIGEAQTKHAQIEQAELQRISDLGFWATIFPWLRQDSAKDLQSQPVERVEQALRAVIDISNREFQRLHKEINEVIPKVSKLEEDLRRLDASATQATGLNTNPRDVAASKNSTLLKYLPGLWEKLASNREGMKLYHENLQALENLRNYESETQARVSAVHASVQSAKNDVSRMESRVSPEQVKDFNALRIEIHLEGLRSSWNRLDSIHRDEKASPRTVEGAP
ncbi:hypothetical protein NMY22_g5626 [Coprinellus aureogranulatus]|nr:hypothetical protein NMY22_g5626 [Coprinellus aureogranulatus]